jgi:hypothetical protein
MSGKKGLNKGYLLDIIFGFNLHKSDRRFCGRKKFIFSVFV